MTLLADRQEEAARAPMLPRGASRQASLAGLGAGAAFGGSPRRPRRRRTDRQPGRRVQDLVLILAIVAALAALAVIVIHPW